MENLKYFHLNLDSSPKTSATKNVHLLSKETMQDTVNVLSTPTRRNRFHLGSNHANSMNDDSPILSQESINISWKWNNEGTPIRSTSKLRRSITNNSVQHQNIQRLSTKPNSKDNQNGTATATATATSSARARATSSPKLVTEPETHSPKGLYKFQEEMRKIQFDTESDKLCDNINDKSMTTDAGYPAKIEETETAQADVQSNARCSDNLGYAQATQNHKMKTNNSQNDNNDHGIDDAFADDLLNDSEFDQMLLTCKMPAQKDASETEAKKTIVKKTDSASEIKPSGDSNSSGSNWELIDDDCFDDLVKDFDADIPVDNLLNTSAKFTRHKSMPQQPQSPATSNAKTFVAKQSVHNQNNMHRKSFTRHESMPIPNTSFSRPSAAYHHNNNNNHSTVHNSGGHFFKIIFL